MKEDMFNQITNDNIAYWLGFIAADGAIVNYKKELHFQFGLSSKDKEHLEKFCIFMEEEQDQIYDRQVKSSNEKYYSASYVELFSNQLIDDLAKYGIIPNKSHQNIDFLSYIPEQYKIPFIIGLFDGDGYFTNTDKSINFGICGNQSVITSVHNYIRQYFKNWQSTESVHQYSKSKITYYFTISTQSEILDWCKLYLSYANKCNLLERKKNIAQNIIDKLEQKILIKQQIEEYKKSLPHNKNGKLLISNFCPVCGKEFWTERKEQIYCSQECSHKIQYRCGHPDKDTLYQILKENKGNFSIAGRMYRVSDNTIRKWCKKYELPFHTIDYTIDNPSSIQRYGRGKRVAQINPKTGEIITIFNSIREAAIQVYGDIKKEKNITEVCSGRHKTTGGYSWKKIDNN